VDCSGGADVAEGGDGAVDGTNHNNEGAPPSSSNNSNKPPPSPRPSSLGLPIYYVDFPSQSCLSSLTHTPSSWVTSEHMYSTKINCCEEMMDWIPLERCLGVSDVAMWSEDNFVWEPTRSPSGSPTISPSARPSVSPSESPSYEPTGRPTKSPSLQPSQAPNNTPTTSPSFQPTGNPTVFKSLAPTTSPSIDRIAMMHEQLTFASAVQDGYLVELIGWANDGLGESSGETFSAETLSMYNEKLVTDEPTASPVDPIVVKDASVSELMLPVVADATISKQRPSVNFGSHQALAVDGGNPSALQGDSNGERFDSLLKFDVSLVDHSRPVESATLRLYIVEGCKSGGTFQTTTDSTWESSTVTWDSAPSSDGNFIGRLPTITAEQWYDVDVTSALSWHDALSGNASYMSIRIESDENSRCLYSSMESGDAMSPRLMVQYMEQTMFASPQVEEVVVEEAPGLISPLESIIPPVQGDFILLRATDDVTIVATNPTRNFGTEDNLLLAFDTNTRGIFDILIRFDLREMFNSPPRSAVLSLFAEVDCDSAGAFASTSGAGEWSEDTVTWANAPIFSPHANDGSGGKQIGTFGAVQANAWYGFNVIAAVMDAVKNKKEAVTFRLSSGNLSSCQFSSRNGGRGPKLMVAF